MHCQLRSAERALFDGEATMVVAHSPKEVFAVYNKKLKGARPAPFDPR